MKMPIADWATWLCWDWVRERESKRGPSEGKGEQGMQRQRTGPRENRRELLASRHHLRTALTHLLASFTSEECTEGGGGESWVWAKRDKTWGLVADTTMVGCRCLQTKFGFLLVLFPSTLIDKTHRCSHLMMNRICACLLWTMTLAVCSWWSW